jgi:hypothetical protein
LDKNRILPMISTGSLPGTLLGLFFFSGILIPATVADEEED